MIGREAYQNPWALAEWERAFCDPAWAPSRETIIEAMVEYAAREAAEHGTPLRAISRHLLGLANGLPGARSFRRRLSDPGELRDATPDLLRRAWGEIRPPASAE